jgi:hypothetical protein
LRVWKDVVAQVTWKQNGERRKARAVAVAAPAASAGRPSGTLPGESVGLMPGEPGGITPWAPSVVASQRDRAKSKRAPSRWNEE